MNSSVSLNTEKALVEYLTQLCPFARAVLGLSDRRNADEEQYEILGAYVPVPAVVVSVSELTADQQTVPVFSGQVSITVRSSSERTTIYDHNRNSNIVSDSLWNPSDIFSAVDESEFMMVSSIFNTGESFNRNGRTLETVFTFDIIISSKE